eukprot:6175902-Pyramimonas_sp.AAC.1
MCTDHQAGGRIASSNTRARSAMLWTLRHPSISYHGWQELIQRGCLFVYTPGRRRRGTRVTPPVACTPPRGG